MFLPQAQVSFEMDDDSEDYENSDQDNKGMTDTMKSQKSNKGAGVCVVSLSLSLMRCLSVYLS